MGKNKRPVDTLVDDVSGWWNKTYVYVKKKEVATWKGALILAFVTGIAVAVIWTAKTNFHDSSLAFAGPNLSFVPSSISTTQGQTFDVSVYLDSATTNVVATRAMINFNPTNFQLVSWSTDSSAFSINNTCQYNSKPCEIIDDNRANGSFSVTLARPTPGVNTSTGKIATLTFKALNPVSQSTSDIKLSYLGAGNNTDSDVILDDGKGTDELVQVSPLTVTVAAPIVTCTSFTYSDWTACQSDGTQTRTVTASSPSGCTGGAPVLSQTCSYTTPAVTCTSFTYSDWTACQSDGTQTRTVTASSPSGCTGGTPVLSQNCTYTSPITTTPTTCTNFNYSKWTTCVNGTQTRTIKSSSPIGCTGGTPVITQTCTATTTSKNHK